MPPARWITNRSGARSRPCRSELARLGVREGQGVGIRGRPVGCLSSAALAALGCGAVVMPIHHQMKPAEMTDMLARPPGCVILDDGCGPGHAGLINGQLAGIARGAQRPALHAARRVLGRRGARDSTRRLVRFTSGTTGAAKGVALTHQASWNASRAANQGVGLTCPRYSALVLPMAYHFYVSILLYLEVGAAVVVSADFLAEMVDSA